MIIPLFSEVELLGIKIKKEVENATKEVKSDIKNIQNQIMNLNLNNSINFQVNGQLPNDKKIQYLEKEMKKDPSNIENEMNFDNLNEEIIFLFKVRFEIEILLNEISEKVGFNEKIPIIKNIQILKRIETIDNTTADSILEICKIANRGIHGEIIDKKYIEFIKQTYPIIQNKLKNVIKDLQLVICPRCKFRGYSKSSNFCPQCSYIFDDY
ncbi:hypothetical protein [Cetobacterium sp.]|uniref:hypothetical protein n=1 Tax=Cetobacterium sp. TaxID=2071632 RepID=UPI003EE4FE3C